MWQKEGKVLFVELMQSFFLPAPLLFVGKVNRLSTNLVSLCPCGVSSSW